MYYFFNKRIGDSHVSRLADNSGEYRSMVDAVYRSIVAVIVATTAYVGGEGRWICSDSYSIVFSIKSWVVDDSCWMVWPMI